MQIQAPAFAHGFSFLPPLLEVSQTSLNYEHDCDLCSETLNWSQLPYKNLSEVGSLFLCWFEV